jgi:hypothetical protein
MIRVIVGDTVYAVLILIVSGLYAGNIMTLFMKLPI